MTYCLDARTVARHFPGIGRHTFNLARGLAGLLAGEERLLLLRKPGYTDGFDFNRVAGPRVTVVEVPSTPFALGQHWQVPAVVRRARAAVYHSPYFLMPLWPGAPTIVTIHDLIPMRLPRYISLRTRIEFAFAMRWAVRTARALIVPSRATAQDVHDLLRVPSERVHVVTEAVDPQFAPQPPAAVAAVCERLGLPRRYVLYLGSNLPHKNVPRLIDAWARLQPQPLPLVIAGVWDERYKAATERAAAHGLETAVRFLGPIAAADLAALYTGAALFVFPSQYEGFGLPVLEAMACGTPVACARSGSLGDVAGDAAALFDADDLDTMAALIGALLRDPDRCADLSRRGLARAQQFSWEEAAHRTLELYRSIAG
jgi:alpha-1,3-rhamnosyl/mannosyltransferase